MPPCTGLQSASGAESGPPPLGFLRRLSLHRTRELLGGGEGLSVAIRVPLGVRGPCPPPLSLPLPFGYAPGSWGRASLSTGRGPSAAPSPPASSSRGPPLARAQSPGGLPPIG